MLTYTERGELSVLPAMVIRKSFGREAKGLRGTQLLALEVNPVGLRSVAYSSSPVTGFFIGVSCHTDRLGNREATPNPVKMQVKRQVPKAQKVREETRERC